MTIRGTIYHRPRSCRGGASSRTPKPVVGIDDFDPGADAASAAELEHLLGFGDAGTVPARPRTQKPVRPDCCVRRSLAPPVTRRFCAQDEST